jgi:hypothetical protein
MPFAFRAHVGYTPTMRKLLIAAAFAVSSLGACEGCASVQDAADQTLPRLHASLEAIKAAYAAACVPVPKGAENTCETARVYINQAGAAYNEANGVVGGPEASDEDGGAQ